MSSKLISPLTFAFTVANRDAVQAALQAQPDADGYVTIKGSKGQMIYTPEAGVLSKIDPDKGEVEITASEGDGKDRDWHLGPFQAQLERDFPKAKGATVSAGEPIGILKDDLKLALWTEENGVQAMHPVAILAAVRENIGFIDAPVVVSPPPSELAAPGSPEAAMAALRAPGSMDAGQGPNPPQKGCWSNTEVGLSVGAGILTWELVKSLLFGGRR